jgi:hypothetical protein
MGRRIKKTGFVSMMVTGGCYTELCKMPDWEVVRGSGGRAAIALAQLGCVVELQTYYSSDHRQRLSGIEMAGVTVRIEKRIADIAFSYLHPLATPYIYPRFIDKHALLEVASDEVLRFGFLEGDAKVSADTAVYDPQSPHGSLFTANGSTANTLAIVLNERELEQIGQNTDLAKAAKIFFDQDGASVVVAKCGVKGALVLEPGQYPSWVPAYHSKRVFKIGTGDIFSAAFAYYWMEQGLTPREAADRASHTVASYAEAPTSPLQISRKPAARPKATIGIIAEQVSLADAWLYEETVSRLTELGAVSFYVPSLTGPYAAQPTCFLLLADTINDASSLNIERLPAPLTVFQQRDQRDLFQSQPRALITNDYATALYWACWGNS